MKRLPFCILFASVLFLTHCASDSSDDSAPSPTGTMTLTGTLGVETVSGLGVKSVVAASDYAVVAIDNETNETYRATTDEAGVFSIEVPSDSSYLLSLVSEGSYVGPTVFDGSGSEVNTAIAPSSDTDLGSITVDTAGGYARTSEAPDSVDDSITAVATDDIPVGAGNDGKTQHSGITNRTDSDEDRDGIPNLFDADEDNDGIRNGIAGLPSGATAVSDHIEAVYTGSNIWAHRDEADEEAYNLIGLTLHVDPIDGHEEMISGVQCIEVPSSIADVTTMRWGSSLGVLEADYPEENSLWSGSGNNLYQTTELPEEEWVVTIRPGADMNVGDTFTIRVTYTDSTYEDFFIPMSYVLTDWARLLTYNGTAMPEDLNQGTSRPGSQITFNSNTLVVTFGKARDEDGNVLEGLNYSLIYGLTTCEEAGCLVPGGETTEEAATDNGDGTLSFTVPTGTAGTYYVTPVAEANGQRNGEETWFTRN